MRLPRLALDEARRLRGGAAWAGPTAIVAKVKNALRLVCPDAQAQAAGLASGMTLSDARAMVPGLEAVEVSPDACARRLERLADACRRYTPTLALNAPDGLFLDISGGAHLFGGEEELAADLISRLAAAGYEAQYGGGDTPGVAWALSGFRPGVIAPPGACAEALASLPPAALDLDAANVAVLAGLGVRSIAQLQGLRRASVARRIGEQTLARLDEALGTRAAPLLTRLEVPPHAAEHRLAEPVCSEAAVLGLVRFLADRLAPRLEGERQGGRRFRLDLFRVDGAMKRLTVEVARPLRDPARVCALFAERLAALNEGLEADYGFDLLRLTVERVDRLEPVVMTLAAGKADPPDPTAFVDRMDARLGVGSVVRLLPDRRTRMPELAVASAAFCARPSARWGDDAALADEGAPMRPLRLFAVPERIEVTAQAPEGAPIQFRWRRLLRRMVKGEGPERLSPEWWREGAGLLTRDYYRVEDREGRRYWVFRQGRFGEMADGSLPPWFIHGQLP